MQILATVQIQYINGPENNKAISFEYVLTLTWMLLPMLLNNLSTAAASNVANSDMYNCYLKLWNNLSSPPLSRSGAS